jgi:hypothetical protein
MCRFNYTKCINTKFDKRVSAILLACLKKSVQIENSFNFVF